MKKKKNGTIDTSHQRKDYSMKPTALIYLERMAMDRHNGNKSALINELIMHFASIEGYRIYQQPIYNDADALRILSDLVENGNKMTPEFRDLLHQIVLAQYQQPPDK
jgi:hypothetical protein